MKGWILIMVTVVLGPWVWVCETGRVIQGVVDDDGVVVSVLGADGMEMTQVGAAQRYGLNGRGTRVCVLDNNIDVTHPTFGGCKETPPWRRPCRLFYNFDAAYPNKTATSAPQVMHGTHTAGIAVGSQPFKLLDAAGQPLPFQRGVAFQASLGAFKIGDAGRSDGTSSLWNVVIRLAYNESVKAKCDVINMSYGYYGIAADEGEQKALQLVSDAGVIPVAAAGNEGGNRGEAYLWTVGSPALMTNVISVAALNNSKIPVTTFTVNRNITSGTDAPSDVLWAYNRVDTKATTEGTLQLPVSLLLLRTSPAFGGPFGCRPLVPVTQFTPEQMKHKGVVLQIMPDCINMDLLLDVNIWDSILALRPVLVLVVFPTEAFSLTGSTRLLNRQVPVFALDVEHGAALAERLASDPTRSVRLMSMGASEMQPMRQEWRGQPTDFSSLGPGIDLGLKPDISAPGAQIYSAAPGDRYHNLRGTSMAAPYLTGVVALWKQRQQQLKVTRPAGDWVAAAARALKNTAQPIRYSNSSLMWPPLKTGAGRVRAMAAAFTEVSISPPELLLRTDVATQALELTLTNSGPSDITYTITHSPAVGVSLTKAWYRQTYDVEAPVAVVVAQPAVVTVPGKGKATVKIAIRMPDALQQLDYIVSGYISFTPNPKQRRATPIPAVPARPNDAFPLTPDEARLSPLSVPYQGSSKDYSTFGLPTSLPLFARPMPDMNAAVASLLQDRPAAFVCDLFQDDSTCMYNTGTVRVRADVFSWGVSSDWIYIAAAMVRPAARLEIEVWCVPTERYNCTTPSCNDTAASTASGSVGGRSSAKVVQQPAGSLLDVAQQQQQRHSNQQGDGDARVSASSAERSPQAAAADVFLGTADAGAAAPSFPLSYNYLGFNGDYYVNGNYSSDPVQPVLGGLYRYRLRLTPPLSQGDASVGRKQAAAYLVDVASSVLIVRRPVLNP